MEQGNLDAKVKRRRNIEDICTYLVFYEISLSGERKISSDLFFATQLLCDSNKLAKNQTNKHWLFVDLLEKI